MGHCRRVLAIIPLLCWWVGLPLWGQADGRLSELVVRNPVFNEGFTGLRVEDAASGRMLFDFRGDKRFTPASNVKLLTWAVAESLLGDSLTAIEYALRNDTLHLRGSGYPLLLHPDLGQADSLANWLVRPGHPLVYHPDSSIARYGPGWSWDDWDYGYVYERTALPVYANRLTLRAHRGNYDREVLPPALTNRVRVEQDRRVPMQRKETDNEFRVGLAPYFYRDTEVRRALITGPSLTRELLADGHGVPVRLANGVDSSLCWRPLRVATPDTLLTHMLHYSDNFLAEQLLLMAAYERTGNFDLSIIFPYVADTLMTVMKLDRRQWVDGSGLSRYNQLSPRQLTALLGQLYRDIGPQAMKRRLSRGGGPGTLNRYFTDGPRPYVWAKTGSLRNVLCLSGLVETKTGRILVFSFMHNHFPGRNRAHYREMERVLRFLRDNY